MLWLKIYLRFMVVEAFDTPTPVRRHDDKRQLPDVSYSQRLEGSKKTINA